MDFFNENYKTSYIWTYQTHNDILVLINFWEIIYNLLHLIHYY